MYYLHNYYVHVNLHKRKSIKCSNIFSMYQLQHKVDCQPCQVHVAGQTRMLSNKTYCVPCTQLSEMIMLQPTVYHVNAG